MAPNVTFTLQARETRGDDLGRRGPGVAHPAHRVHRRHPAMRVGFFLLRGLIFWPKRGQMLGILDEI